MKNDNNVHLPIDQIQSIVLASVLNAFETGEVPPNIFIHGTMGVGKTQTAMWLREQVEKEMTRETILIDFRISAVEPTDIQGTPYNAETGKMITALDGNGEEYSYMEKKLVTSTPQWWPDRDDVYYILLLDELTSCTKSQQHAAYRILQERSCNNGATLGNNVMILSAGNLPEDMTGAKPLLPAAANRFAMHLYVDADKAAEPFITWGINNDIHVDVISYLNFNGSKICSDPIGPAFARPRTWERVSDHIKNPRFTEDERRIAICAAVGVDVGIDFTGFQEYRKYFPDWDKIAAGDKSYTIPDSPEAQYALITPLAFKIIEAVENADETKLDNFCDLALKFPPELLVVLIRTARANKKVVTQMVMNPTLRRIHEKTKEARGIK